MPLMPSVVAFPVQLLPRFLEFLIILISLGLDKIFAYQVQSAKVIFRTAENIGSLSTMLQILRICQWSLIRLYHKATVMDHFHPIMS